MQKLLKQFDQTSVTGFELKGDQDLTSPPFFLDHHACEIPGDQVKNALSQAVRVWHGGTLVVCAMSRAERPGCITAVKYFTPTATSTRTWSYSCGGGYWIL